MYLWFQLKIFFLLFFTIICDTKYHEYDKINQEDPIEHSWPMIVSIRYDCQHEDNSVKHCCVGTILTDSYILTAADCVDSLPSDVTIVTGIHSRSESQQVIRKVDQIIIHPNWKNDRNGLKHNIAILHLTNSLDFTMNKHITRAGSLTQSNLSKYPSNSTRLLVINWNSAKKDFDSLQQTEAFLVDKNDPICNRLVYDVEEQFCARSYHDSKNLCNHESGQPILQWIDNRWVQVGIINSIIQRTSSNCLGVYTRLAYYHEWIESVLNSKNPTSFTISTTDLAVTYECNIYTASCGCSAKNVELSSTRIIGGEEAVPYSWSMVVSIHLNNSEEHSCGGSILTASYILTSAHCVDGALWTEIYIVAGIHNRIEDFPTIRYVYNVFIHRNWNKSDDTYRDDIAILYIFPPLPIDGNENLARTCVPYINSFNETINYPSNGSHLVIVGWGSTQCDDNNNISDTLQQASVYTIDHNDPICSQSIYDVEKQFCAGMNGRGPCYGDVGGPIFQWKGTYWEQVGITSYGGKCDPICSPGIFTRLAYYFDWMESVINSSLTTTTPKPPPPPISYVCNKTSTCGCGKTDVALTPSRIVGGEDALEDSWPMIVSLRLNGTHDHSCAGTILSNSYILTAAHCLRRINVAFPTGITIAAGMTNRSDPLQIIRTVDRIYMHPDYANMPSDYRHDIALLHIDQPFVFESTASFTKTCIHRIPSSISTNQYPKNGTLLAVIGWGTLRFGTIYLPEILQQAQVFTIDNQDPICLNIINNTDLQFCAGLFEGGKDSCQGDSGGPIFQWTGQYWEQVGIVSYGRGCAFAGLPGIYTRLSYYYRWIEEILKRDGEYLEPNILSYTTTMEPSITNTSEMHTTTTITYWPSSTTSKMVIPNSTYKYKFDILIFGPFVLLFLFFFI